MAKLTFGHGENGFDPAKELPEGFQQILMKHFFYSSLDDKQTCLDDILKILSGKKFLPDEKAVNCARLCIDEALVNAVKHGNKHDQQKRVQVTLYGAADAWAIRVEDEGRGFSPDDLPDYNSDDTLFMESGRGVLLMREFMDKVYYYDRGNRLLMIKYHKTDRT